MSSTAEVVTEGLDLAAARRRSTAEAAIRTFVGWRRSRAEMLAAGAAGSDSAGAGLLSWVGAGTLPLLAIALAHVIAFACAANRWRASRSRRGPACGDEVPVSDCAEVKPPRVKTLRQGLTLRLHGGLIMLLR